MPTERQNAREGNTTSLPARVLVLLSGGVDSASCVAFYQRKQFEVDCLFVDYRHPAARSERRAAATIADHYGVQLHQTTVQGLAVHAPGFVRGRNALLVSTALAGPAPRSGLLALGIHGGTSYPDCTRRFIDLCQSLADLYTSGSVRITAPFLEWTKGDIFTFAKQVGVPLEQTYSCEAGGPAPCGTCLSCRDRVRGQ